MVSGEVVIAIGGKEVALLHAGEVFLRDGASGEHSSDGDHHGFRNDGIVLCPRTGFECPDATLVYKVLLGVAQQMSARIRGANENIFTPNLPEMMAKRLMNGQNSIVGSPLTGECRAPGPLFPLFHAAGRLAGGSFSIVV
jgi:hypothetical protein